MDPRGTNVIRYDQEVKYRQSVFQLPNADVSIQWLGGHFTGEGCIASQKQKSCTLSNGIPRADVQLVVASTEPDEARIYKDYFGVGTIVELEFDNPNHSTQTKWTVTRNRDVKLVLEQLSPHIRLGPKTKQAQLALELVQLKQQATTPISVSTAEEMIHLVEEIQELTQPGPSKEVAR